MRFDPDTFFDPIWHAEPTLDELLAEPAARLLMQSDGVDEASLRELAREIAARVDDRRLPGPVLRRDPERPRLCLC